MGVTVVDKIKTPSPKFTWKPKPVFKTSLERDKYWDQQDVYYRDGYGDGHARVCGMHYYYMQEGWLKDGADGTPIRPRYRDCDEWIISEIHKEFWKPTGALGFIKRREIGLTSIGAGLLPSYTFRMYPSSTFGLTSADKDRIYKAYTDKTEVFLTRIDKDIRPYISKKNETSQNVYLQLQTKVIDELDNEYFQSADLFSKETSRTDKSASGFSGTRMRAAFFDELPLHPRKKLLLRSSKACFMKGPEYAGLLLWGGTVEETLTAEEIQEFQKLVSDATILKHKIIFIPAWWGLFMNEAGESDEKKGLRWAEDEIERLSKSDDPDDLRAFKLNYPTQLSDIFELGNGSRWEEYTRERINIQVKELVKPENRPPIEGFGLVDLNGKIISSPSAKSNIKILEHPKKDVQYILGVDATSSTEFTSEKKGNSKFSMTIMKGVDPSSNIQFAPVCIFTERPKDFDAVFEKGIMLLRYYNEFGNAKITGELNATGAVFVELIQKRGYRNTILPRYDISNKGWVDKSKPWFSRADAVKNWQYLAGNTYFKKYVEMVKFLSLLHDAQKKDNENTDTLDSFLACLYGWRTGDLLGDKPKQKKVPIIEGIRPQYKDGVMVGYETYNILQNGQY